MTPTPGQTPDPAARPVLQSLREALPELPATMRRAGEAILEDPLAAGSASITALAERSGVNPATVSRLAARLGFGGYPELRSAIALENGRNAQSDWERDIGGAISPEDSAEQVLSTLAGAAARALRDATAVIDVAQVERAARAIAGAERVHLHGDWGDAIAIRELHIRLQRIGVAAWFLEGGPSALHALAGTFTDRDVLVVLSRSGEDGTATSLLAEARAAGAATVGLHGLPGGAVERAAQIGVFTGIRNGEVWTQYYSGRASDTLVASLLWVLVAQLRSADDSRRFIDTGVLGDPR